MKFIETKLKGVFIIEPEITEDQRGFFARTFCRDEFKRHSLVDVFLQCGFSYNKKKGTLRGIHYQVHPHEETKLIRCVKGSVYDVVLDLREGSPTFGQSVAEVLSDDGAKMIYVPKGCGHGFQTLEDDSEVFYQITPNYNMEASRGIRWDDPFANIDWPIKENLIISEKDQGYEFLKKT